MFRPLRILCASESCDYKGEDASFLWFIYGLSKCCLILPPNFVENDGSMIAVSCKYIN